MRELERAAGGKTAAARQAGVTLRTWERWVTGQHKPRAASLARLARAQRESRLTPRRRQRLSSGGGLTVTGTVRVSADTRTRTVNLGDDLDPELAERMADAYQSGDEEALDQALQEAITEYVPGMEVLDVDSIRF